MGTHNLRDVSPLLSYRAPAPQAPAEAKGFYLEAVRKNGTIARRVDASGWDTARIREEVFSMLLTLDNIDHVHEAREGCISSRDWSTRLSSTKKESRPNKDDFGYRAARAVFALAAVALLALVVLGVLDYRDGRRCERSGRCDVGRATWVDSKCVCVVYAK